MRQLFSEYQEFIPDFDSFLESLRRPLPNHLRVNRLKTSPVSVIGMLQEKGISLTPVHISRGHPYTKRPGLCCRGSCRSTSSAISIPRALTSCLPLCAGAETESSVLDLWRRTWRKDLSSGTTHGQYGDYCRHELRSRRHAPLSHTLSRLGVLNAVQTAYPAQEFPLRHSFDFIMADVPCSGEGRWRLSRGPDTTEESRYRAGIAEAQKRMILRGFDLLKREGIMAYCTVHYNRPKTKVSWTAFST